MGTGPCSGSLPSGSRGVGRKPATWPGRAVQVSRDGAHARPHPGKTQGRWEMSLRPSAKARGRSQACSAWAGVYLPQVGRLRPDGGGLQRPGLCAECQPGPGGAGAEFQLAPGRWSPASEQGAEQAGLQAPPAAVIVLTDSLWGERSGREAGGVTTPGHRADRSQGPRVQTRTDPPFPRKPPRSPALPCVGGSRLSSCLGGTLEAAPPELPGQLALGTPQAPCGQRGDPGGQGGRRDPRGQREAASPSCMAPRLQAEN